MIKCSYPFYFLLLNFMTQKEMFEKSFERPKNYFKLHEDHQWAIDARLGILDWVGRDLTEEETKRFRAHYK